MAALPPALQEELASLFVSLDGVERTRYLCIAATCVLLYDMLLTFDEEVEYFWKPGPWSLTRVLFFWNRYFPPVILLMCIYGLFAPNLSLQFCKGWIHSEFLLSIAGLAIVQAIIVLRICYVYSKDFVTRAFVVGCFVACTIISLVIFGKIWHDVDPVAIPVPGLKLNGCTAPQAHQIWKIFIPNLALHTLLYLATTLPPLRMRRMGKRSQLLDRLAMDGGIFYFSVFAIAMFTTIGALAKSPLVNLPAIYSNALLGIAAASVSRLMLSIRSLAARLSVNPDWLLNNTELSRVNWKYGGNGDLIVEINRGPDQDDLELTSIDDDMPKEKRSATPAVYTTRVGVLEDVVYPGTRDYKAPPRPKKTTKVTFQENHISSRDSCDV
ncbi:hypothetical protein PYCCODRAFT_1436691 [Trametes coccinea BRFM310]|uniref:DUF6533 domain-containing protein n=1 Tax=Trametes coccinea (strain BRFM310) TaxID=1353009 RepID=A0A1Y2IJA7_TRAC3|nr:hypothetical protein PYCCODRAFT_1436691 [Trametes coccinea BRFM310]